MSERVTLKDWTDGTHKVRAVKVIRKYGGLGLKSGKQVIDQCLDGNESSFEVSGKTGALKAAEQLSSLGFVVQVDREVFKPGTDEPEESNRDRAVGILVPHRLSRGSEKNTFNITGKLQSGTVREGQQLGIPIHETLTVVATVEHLNEKEEELSLTLRADDEEAFEFWESMEVVGMELLVLPSKGRAA